MKSVILKKQLFYPMLLMRCCLLVAYETRWAQWYFWYDQTSLSSPTCWKLLYFPFHSALISAIMFPRHVPLYLLFVVVGFSAPDVQIAFVEWFSERHPWNTQIHRLTNKHNHFSDLCSFFCCFFLFICSFIAFSSVIFIWDFEYFFILCFVDSKMATGFKAWPVWKIFLL